MGMTITEKILARAAGSERVEPGELVTCKVDFCLANDITAPLAIETFEAIGAGEVFDTERVALVPDHFTPNRDIRAAEQAARMRGFAKKTGIRHYFEVGEMGIEHVLLPEQGLVLPGDVIIGADSHTCTYGAVGAFSTGVGSTDLGAVMALGEIWLRVPSTIRFDYRGAFGKWVSGKDLILHTIGTIGVDGALYKSMEFRGEAIDALSMDGRFTMANMAIEAGAKNGIFHFDEKTQAYLKSRSTRDFTPLGSDEDAAYEAIVEIDVGAIEPVVALPHLPSNVVKAAEATDVEIDQVVIGSCTNGRIEDLAVAASLLRGRKVRKGLRLIVIPGSQGVTLEALRCGYIETFIQAGAAVSTPTCGPCLGGHMGILAPGEKALATTNRNFTGRMGHAESEVYLCGPAVAAASAVTGRITHPEELKG